MDESPGPGGEMGALSLLNPLIFPLIPVQFRAPVSALWRANAQFAAMACGGKEPGLRQIKLRWWADQLTALRTGKDHHDPLLTSLAHDLLPHISALELSIFAESWMAQTALAAGYASESGAHLFTMTGRILDQSHLILTDAGRAWGMIDQAIRSGETGDWSAHQQRLNSLPLRLMPRALAALTGMARRIARANGRRSARGEQWTIFRIGLFGR